MFCISNSNSAFCGASLENVHHLKHNNSYNLQPLPLPPPLRLNPPQQPLLLRSLLRLGWDLNYLFEKHDLTKINMLV